MVGLWVAKQNRGRRSAAPPPIARRKAAGVQGQPGDRTASVCQNDAGRMPQKETRRVLTVYVDADACPVKDETYRVARRYGLRVVVAANAPMRVPTDPLIDLTVLLGFGEVDDW